MTFVERCEFDTKVIILAITLRKSFTFWISFFVYLIILCIVMKYSVNSYSHLFRQITTVLTVLNYTSVVALLKCWAMQHLKNSVGRNIAACQSFPSPSWHRAKIEYLSAKIWQYIYFNALCSCVAFHPLYASLIQYRIAQGQYTSKFIMIAFCSNSPTYVGTHVQMYVPSVAEEEELIK